MRSRRKGVAAVEFALVAPLLCMMVLGMVEIGRAVQVKMALTNAVREGCRGYADSTANLSSGYQTGTIAYAKYVVLDALQNSKLKINTNNVTVTTSSEAVTVGGLSMTKVTVTASIPYSSISYFSPFLTHGNLTASVTMKKSV
jgi:Flp pilus assembly protein TadG